MRTFGSSLSTSGEVLGEAVRRTRRAVALLLACALALQPLPAAYTITAAQHQYISFADLDSIDQLSAVSVFVRVKINTGATDATIVGDEGTAYDAGWLIEWASGTTRIYCSARPAGSYPYTYFDYTGNLDTWHEIGMVYNGATNVVVYLDGVAVSSTSSGTPPATLPANSNGLAVGVDLGSGPSHYLDGAVADVAVWKAALTATDFARIHDSNGNPLRATRTPDIYIDMVADAKDRMGTLGSPTLSGDTAPSLVAHPPVYRRRK